MFNRRLIPWFFLLVLIFAGCGKVEQAEPGTITRYPAADRIVAIGDLHGDLDATRSALKLAGAINDDDHWIGGKLVLVQTGDQLDRGDQEQAILDLFSRLSEEAAGAGGAVHILNGNHELMNADLDLRYVTEGGFRDFLDAVPVGEVDSLLAGYPPEQRGRVAAFRPGGSYAQVMAQRNTIVIIGDNLFVHGGVLVQHIEYGLDRMNSEIRAWLRGELARPEWSRGGVSPVWSRNFSYDVDDEDSDELAEVLNRLGVKRMIVGHSIQDGGITAYCDARVWCIDVGMSAHYGGVPKVLEIQGEMVRVLRQK